ncbi:MAG TPA: hypothetical protein VND65_05115 [Candidatus Binatia bacterium]|nr:hypothetical protein [Candidatus Binatia bacterium]
MKKLFLMLALGVLPCANGQQLGVYQHGTVVRMKMGDCLPVRQGFMATMGGPPVAAAVESCPEYTLVSEKVVYIAVAISANQLIPLAEVIDFRIHKGEVAVRVNDAKKESRFTIKEMILRSEWDLVRNHITQELTAPPRRGGNGENVAAAEPQN